MNRYFMFPEVSRNLLALSRARRILRAAKRAENAAVHSSPVFMAATERTRMQCENIVFDLECSLGLHDSLTLAVHRVWRKINHA